MGHLHHDMPPPAQPPLCAAANAFSYMRCSIYVLTRFGHRRNRDMRLRWATITAALAGLAFVVPAQAQEEMAAEAAAAPEMRPDGFRIAEGSNGFQLVEHGIWRQPLAASSGAPVLEAGRTYLPYRYAKPEAGGPSGFRRASYLPHVYAAEAQYSLPSGLLDALVWTESRYNPDRKSVV